MIYKGTPLEKVKIYTMQGIDMMHITDFTTATLFYIKNTIYECF